MPDSKLYSSLFSDYETATVFSDDPFIFYMLSVEAQLAVVQGELGVIPQEAAQKIAFEAFNLQVNMDALKAGIEKDGVPVIELVRQLRAHIGGDAASYVHWGATTQDIMDTALVLQIRDCLDHVVPILRQVMQNLAKMADQHRSTLMAGRTHSQQALPITFGLKVVGWLAPLLRHHQRLAEIQQRVCVIQLGGAAGTLASLGEMGIKVQEALASQLNLSLAAMPWHTQRDSIVELAGWMSLVTGSLAKMAQDIILMAQTEIGEVAESGDSARGGSSTMPQKRNPIISENIIAAARTNASLLSAMHHAMIQEHERATHGWQIEWINLPQMFALTASALNKAVFLSENLVVDEARMRENVAASNGLMLAEAVNLALAPYLGRVEAKELVGRACQTAIVEKRHLVDVVREQTDAPVNWDSLRDEANYLGSSDAFIDRVLEEVKKQVEE